MNNSNKTDPNKLRSQLEQKMAHVLTEQQKAHEEMERDRADINLLDHTLESQTSSGSDDTDFRNLSPKERR